MRRRRAVGRRRRGEGEEEELAIVRTGGGLVVVVVGGVDESEAERAEEKRAESFLAAVRCCRTGGADVGIVVCSGEESAAARSCDDRSLAVAVVRALVNTQRVKSQRLRCEQSIPSTHLITPFFAAWRFTCFTSVQLLILLLLPLITHQHRHTISSLFLSLPNNNDQHHPTVASVGSRGWVVAAMSSLTLFCVVSSAAR